MLQMSTFLRFQHFLVVTFGSILLRRAIVFCAPAAGTKSTGMDAPGASFKGMCDSFISSRTTAECFAQFQQWCQRSQTLTRSETTSNNICNKYYPPSRDAKTLTSANSVQVENFILTNSSNENEAQRVERMKRQDNGEQRAVKASRESLNGLKSVLNQAAEQFAEQLNRLRTFADAFLPKPPPNAQHTHTELAVNDPEDYFQGDVDLTEQQVERLLGALDTASNWLANLGNLGGFGRKKRKVSKQPNYERWPDPSKDPISYQFDGSVPPATQEKITQAIKLWEANTCVRFRKDGPGIDRIEFYNGPGCSSFVGKAGGTQQISLHTPGCDFVGIASHEIGHALGFFHEQARPDQEQYVSINYNNILLWRYNNFVPQSWTDVDDFGEKYDHGSVMHYDSRTRGFTINENDYAIISKDKNYQSTMGQRVGPSFVDFKQVNKAYCANKCPAPLGCQNGGYEDPNQCSVCKCPSGFGGVVCDNVAPSSAGCGGLLLPTKDWQTIQSPNYPNKFPTGLTCNWLLKAPEGFKVFLEFDGPTFDFECKDTCAGSYVELKKGPDFEITGYRLCCTERPKTQFVSSDNYLAVILSTNGVAGRGFSARYKTDAQVTGGPQPPQTVPTLPPATLPTTSATIPSTFAPVVNCECSDWSGWSGCNDQCGGCGRISRTRSCNIDNKDCHNREEKPCNMGACPGNPNGFQFTPNGRFAVMNQGCCLGLFNTNGECRGLSDAIGDQITKLFGGFGFGKK